MSYPKQLLRLQPTRGLVFDVADQEVGLDFWTGGENIIFRDGFASRLPGYREAYNDELITATITRLHHAVNAPLNDVNYWLIVDADGEIFSVQEGSSNRINGLLFNPTTSPAQVSSALINGIPILSDAQTEPVYWDGAGSVQILPDWTATESARFIAVLKFHVFALNISGPSGDFRNLVKWSAATEPGTVPASWTPSPDNDAGSVELADSPGQVLCAYPLGDSLLIYKRSATYQARFVGGQNVFSFRKVQSATGALTPRSVCDIGGRHFIVSDGDVLLSDGTNVRSIGESRINDLLFGQIDDTNFVNLFCTYNQSRDEVLIGVPTQGNQYANLGFVYDVSRDAWGTRTLDQVADASNGRVTDGGDSAFWNDQAIEWDQYPGVWTSSNETEARDSLVLVESVALEQQDSDTAVAFPAVVARTGLTFGEAERIKFVRRVHIRTRDPYSELFVRVGASMLPNGPITWSPTVTINDTEQIVNAFAQGRYIAVEISSSDAAVWKLTGVDIEAELRGYF